MGWGRHSLLFVGVTLLIILQPMLRPGPAAAWGLTILRTIVLVGGLMAVWRHRRLSRIGTLLVVVVAFLAVIVDHLARVDATTIASEALVLVALGLIGATIFVSILRTPRVSTDTLFAAACVYLVLGLCWARVHLFVEWFVPGSYSPGMEDGIALGALSQHFVYFSFVTLSTMGYGDVLPVHPAARNLAALEAVTGQLFVAILIGQLVGLHMRDEA